AKAFLVGASLLCAPKFANAHRRAGTRPPPGERIAFAWRGPPPIFVPLYLKRSLTAARARRPINLPGCKRCVCRDGKCGRPLAGNRAPSIGWRESRRPTRGAANGLLAGAFRFHLRSL